MVSCTKKQKSPIAVLKPKQRASGGSLALHCFTMSGLAQWEAPPPMQVQSAIQP